MAKQKVWIIMGNDFPNAVFATEKAAQKYVDERKAEQQKQISKQPTNLAHIYWRAYKFEVQT